MDAKDIKDLCKARNWTRARLVHELRRAASAQRLVLPEQDDSLKRMIRGWANGQRGLSEMYADLLTQVFGVEFNAVERQTGAALPEAPDLAARLDVAASVDGELVALLEGQTQNLRGLDRRLGARTLGQTELHVSQITELLSYCRTGSSRPALAAAGAEAAALAGWQALDLGNPDRAWQHHDVARNIAREAQNSAVLAHVTAQQAYSLLDLDRPVEAASLIEHARNEAGTDVPPLLRSWLLAAEAEAHAAAGNELASRRTMDLAGHEHPDIDRDPDLPFIFLGEGHLRRWRGHCLARLGAAEAIDELSTALEQLDTTFTRAAAGLRCDLALAHSVRGNHELARTEARIAARLADQTASARQQRRINDLSQSGQWDH